MTALKVGVETELCNSLAWGSLESALGEGAFGRTGALQELALALRSGALSVGAAAVEKSLDLPAGGLNLAGGDLARACFSAGVETRVSIPRLVSILGTTRVELAAYAEEAQADSWATECQSFDSADAALCRLREAVLELSGAATSAQRDVVLRTAMTALDLGATQKEVAHAAARERHTIGVWREKYSPGVPHRWTSGGSLLGPAR